MIKTNQTKDITEIIGASLQASIEQVKQECIEAAVCDFKSALREEVGKTALLVSNFYEIQRMQDTIVIKVKVGDEDEN